MAKKEAYKIFLSCGTPYNKSQEKFLSAIEEYLKSHNCIPTTVGRSDYSVRQPVQYARDLIADCDGALVIALKRMHVIDGVDKPGSAEEKSISGHFYATPWNQIEAAMAYAKDVPIFTIVQKGIQRSCMLSDRFEWFALEDDITLSLLKTDKFNQFFQDWIARVEESKAIPKKSVDPSKLKIFELFSLLTVGQLWAVIAAALSVLVAVATVAYKLGQFYCVP